MTPMRLRRIIPRFSLRTLVILLLLVTSATALWHHWEPWYCERVLEGHEGLVCSAAFSPDGRRVVTAGYEDLTARIWDAAGGECLAVLKGHEGRVHSAAFSPDGRKVVTAGWDDGTARVWDAAGGECLAVLRGHEGTVCSAEFSPDGRRVVTSGSDDGTARIWRRTRPEHRWGVIAMPEVWATVLFAGLLAWSIVRDRRALREAA